MEQLDFLLIFTTDVKTYSCGVFKVLQVMFIRIKQGEFGEPAEKGHRIKSI